MVLAAPCSEVGKASSFCFCCRGLEMSGMEPDNALAKRAETKAGGVGERGKAGPCGKTSVRRESDV